MPKTVLTISWRAARRQSEGWNSIFCRLHSYFDALWNKYSILKTTVRIPRVSTAKYDIIWTYCLIFHCNQYCRRRHNWDTMHHMFSLTSHKNRNDSNSSNCCFGEVSLKQIKTKFSPNLSFMLFEKRKNYITPNLSVHIISLERMIGWQQFVTLC